MYDKLEKQRVANANGIKLELSKQQKAQQDAAYKAIIIPIVGLGLSIVCLFINAFSWLNLIISDKSVRLAWVITGLLTLGFIAKLAITLPGLPIIDETFVSGQNILIKFIYYYEHLGYNMF